MIPMRDTDISTKYKFVESSTKTYGMVLEGDRIRSYIDNKEAMKQAIYKIILTERYKYVIYSWNYGIELRDLFGKPIPYCCVELERRIKEALLQDNRISNVYNFEFSNPKPEVILVKFTADTIFGDIKITREVNFTNV